MQMTKVVKFVGRGFGYLVVGAVLLGLVAAVLGGLERVDARENG